MGKIFSSNRSRAAVSREQLIENSESVDTRPDQREQSLELMISEKLTPDISTSSDKSESSVEELKPEEKLQKSLVSEISLTAENVKSATQHNLKALIYTGYVIVITTV